MTFDGPVPVTVVIITRDRRAEVLATIPRLLALPERPPVIVVDNASGDTTAAAVRARFPMVRVVRLDRNLAAAGRNVGARLACTPYVAFADDDSWWRPGALARAARVLDQHPDVAVVAAHIRIEPDGRDDPVCVAMERSPLLPPPGLSGRTVLGFVACAAVARVDPFLAVGGFDARFGVGGEEALTAIDLAAAGWAICYVPDLVAHHAPSIARDHEQRASNVARNDLWTAWLRRPLPVAWRATARLAARALRDRAARRGLLQALRGAPSVLRTRRPLPRHVEANLQLVERGCCGTDSCRRRERGAHSRTWRTAER